LRLWITLCREESHEKLVKIHPEEMALLALTPNCAAYLRQTLSHAKLFAMSSWSFLRRSKDGARLPLKEGEEPEELKINFVFFDSTVEQFLQPEEDYASGHMRMMLAPSRERTTSRDSQI